MASVSPALTWEGWLGRYWGCWEPLSFITCFTSQCCLLFPRWRFWTVLWDNNRNPLSIALYGNSHYLGPVLLVDLTLVSVVSDGKYFSVTIFENTIMLLIHKIIEKLSHMLMRDWAIITSLKRLWFVDHGNCENKYLLF